MPHQPSSDQSNDPTDAFVREYSRFTQFHGIPDRTLIRLAERKTGLRVSNRWIAIALIIRNPLPIPVPRAEGATEVRRTVPDSPAKLTLINGGKSQRPPESQQRG
jgi:hypothetical protein